MQSTMQEIPLSVSHLFRHGQRVHKRSHVRTFDGERLSSSTFEEVGERVEKLANALRRLGVGPGDRVATFMWNNQEHLEAYFAVPGIGAVLHTLNLRLFPDQLAHVVNEAEDKVIIVNASVLPLLVRVADKLETVEHYVVVDDGPPAGTSDTTDGQPSRRSVLHYADLLDEEEAGIEWPEVDELDAAVMCYTSGTTGEPKGVLYSHRSTYLHAFGFNNAGSVSLNERHSALVIVPMFHVNAWGWPFTAWLVGTDLVMPARFLQGGPLLELIELARPTVSAGVPTIWGDLLGIVAERPDADLSSLELLISGGSALPRTIVEGFDKLGVRMIQGWGMTETSPICALSEPPVQVDSHSVEWRLRTGRVVPGVEARIVTEDGSEAPWDGETTGEIQVRGPWITGSYYANPSPEKFDQGWLRTGDIGSIDDYGFMQISDRLKDVIKSGGEWISSVELENELMGHPEVVEASVVAVSDEKWGERPLAVVVRRSGSQVDAGALSEWLSDRVAKWWVPERWAFVEEIPKTSVGKFDKKSLRADHTAGRIQIQTLG